MRRRRWQRSPSWWNAASMKNEEKRAERVLEGLGVSPGIAIGPSHVIEQGDVPVPEYDIAPEGVPAELVRFDEAVAVSIKQLRKLKTKAGTLPDSAAEEMGLIPATHLAMLSGSRLVRGVARRIEAERMNAERAIQSEIGAIRESFAGMRDAYLAARFDDVRVVGARLLRNLTKTPYDAFKTLPEGT